MPAKNKPYEEFGPYLLFRKFESDAISELWRAGRIDGAAIGAVVALRRFTGGDRSALSAAAMAAESVVPQLTGTSFVRDQQLGVIDGVPYLAHDYAGGRSLRHIVDRARGSHGNAPNPIPLDQAIAIAEKVALSVATTGELRSGGTRLAHGALIPQLVWITDDGEIRVGGQMLGPGFVASMSDPAVSAELARYFAPEMLQSGLATKASEVFALGAMLYLLVTALEPPDAANASAFGQAVVAAKMLSGAPVPPDIRAILARSLALDPATRYPSVAEMKQAISTLAQGGPYTATTFNLAFYVSSLLKKELDSEGLERDREMKVNVAAYLFPTPEPEAAEPAAAEPPAPMFAASAKPEKGRPPIAATAVIVIAALGMVGYYMLAIRKPASPAKNAPAVAAPRPQLVSHPLVATSSVSPASTTATDTASSAAAQKSAFEQAVEQKLQEEMMKLQQEYTQKLQQKQSSQAPAPAAAAARQEPTTAAQLDEQHLATHAQDAAPPPAPPTAQQVPATQPAQTQPAAALPEPAAPAVHEGDIIEVSSLDSIPHVVQAAAPVYPPMAARQRVESTVIITALISESGEVIDAKILRGDRRFGFEDAALRAVRSTRFSSPMKDGKRVKTWFPVPVTFKL